MRLASLRTSSVVSPTAVLGTTATISPLYASSWGTRRATTTTATTTNRTERASTPAKPSAAVTKAASATAAALKVIGAAPLSQFVKVPLRTAAKRTNARFDDERLERGLSALVTALSRPLGSGDGYNAVDAVEALSHLCNWTDRGRMWRCAPTHHKALVKAVEAAAARCEEVASPQTWDDEIATKLARALRRLRFHSWKLSHSLLERAVKRAKTPKLAVAVASLWADAAPESPLGNGERDKLYSAIARDGAAPPVTAAVALAMITPDSELSSRADFYREALRRAQSDLEQETDSSLYDASCLVRLLAGGPADSAVRGPWSEEFQKRMETVRNATELETRTISRFQRSVIDAIRVMGYNHRVETPANVDIEIRLSSSDVAAVQCLGPSHYCWDQQTLEGRTRLSNRLLVKSGQYSRVVLVSHSDWTLLARKGDESLREYLARGMA